LDGDRKKQNPRTGKRRAPHQGGRLNRSLRREPKPAPPRALPAGLAGRDEAVRLIAAVLMQGRALDDALAEAAASRVALEPRDRAFARLIATTVLRRLGELDVALATFITKPLPEKQGALRPILLAATAQLMALDTPPHAAISLAVEQCRADREARRFDRLANAVLRRVAEQGRAILSGLDAARVNVPDWMLRRWVAEYGEPLALEIAAASLVEAPLDLSVKADPVAWAEKLGGAVLGSGTVRMAAPGRVDALPGFAEGAWWVQDVAAALPARLLGDVAGLTVADLCAAPGGKTAELAAAGARVIAVDQSIERLRRLSENMLRLGLRDRVDIVADDAATWQTPSPLDAVLLDSPCTATGTIRRRPDILRLKRPEDLPALAALQAQLLDHAAGLVRPGGLIVYCVCSLEPEEGRDQVAALLHRRPDLVREPVRAGEWGIDAAWITPEGDMRTLPCHLPHGSPGMSGMDGFYAARLRRF